MASRLESSPPLKSLFGPAFWLVLGAGLFVVFWFQTGPSEDIQTQMSAAGPGGVTAYFATPETATARTAVLLAERDWPRLAAYYDLRGSSVTQTDLVSGRYFTAGGARRPFPAGFRLLRSDRIGPSVYFRAVLGGNFRTPGDYTSGQTLNVYFIHSPEGYRFVPRDAAPLRAALAGTAPAAPGP